LQNIKESHFKTSTRDLIAMADLEKMHSQNISSMSYFMSQDESKAHKYDSIITSVRYSISALTRYREMANIISYIFEFNWELISIIITFALTAAINPRVVFMQSSFLGDLVANNSYFKTILLQVFYYMGMLDFPLLSAIGHLLLETNMFNKVDRITEYQSVIGAKSLLSVKEDRFKDGSRAKETVVLIKNVIDRKKIISLTMIINGFINVTITRPIEESVRAAQLGLSTLASSNLTSTKAIITFSMLSDEEIIKTNTMKPADEQYQIDNITRAIEGRKIIKIERKLSDVEFLVKICYTTEY